MKRKSLVLFIAVTFASVLLFTELTGIVCAADAAKTYKFRLQHWQSTSTDTYKLFISEMGFPAMVERASGGRIKIETYAGSSIIPPMQNMRAVGKGVVDMAAGCGAYQGGIAKYFSLLYGIPFALDNSDDLEIVWREMGLYEYAKTLYAKYNTHLLGWNSDAPVGIFSKREIKTLEDFKGLKIRAVGTYADFFNMLGASAMSTTSAEIYLSLDRGLVDACSWGSEAAMRGIGLQEVTDYIVLPYISGAAPNDMMINLDTWNVLPDDLKQIMTSCYQEYSSILGARYRYNNYKDRSTIIDKDGMKLNILPEADVEKAKKMAIKLMDKYETESPEAAKIIGIYKDYLKLKSQSK